MAQDQTTPVSMYCRKCGYQLVGLSENRCPECGQSFDPGVLRTFLRHPKGCRRRLWLRRTLIILGSATILGLVGLSILLGALRLRWQAQQRVIAAVRQIGGVAVKADDPRSPFKVLLGRSSYWPDGYCMGVAADPGLLGTRFAWLLDETEEVILAKRPSRGNMFGALPTEDRTDEFVPVDDAWLQQWVQALARLPRLKVLIISSNQVTDQGVRALEVLPSDVHLTVCCPLASQRALDELKQTHSHLSVEQNAP